MCGSSQKIAVLLLEDMVQDGAEWQRDLFSWQSDRMKVFLNQKKKKNEEQTNWQVEGLIDLVNLC